jgi:CRISPR-associated endonuclease/helicase Cas3
LAAPQFPHFHQLAEWCGLLHDYGKYTDCFQQMITSGTKMRCPHAIHGAVMVTSGLPGFVAPHIASAIAGHHAGLPNLGELREKLTKARNDALALVDRARRDCPELDRLAQSGPPTFENPGSRFDLLTRMLLSCLVDADRLDTALREAIQSPLDAQNRLTLLLRYLDQLSEGNSEGVVKAARREVLDDCLQAASYPEQIFSLSVPTGGGKTLSAMAFALQRAALYPDRYRRIIVVIPYLSIIEQNAEVYANVFGADSILEHHSGSFARVCQRDADHFELKRDDDDEYQRLESRPETENWDSPLIVTTSVRFFESLFSNHPSDLRRVHNIARSIVIVDEVQVLPRSLLAPLLEMIDELAVDWGCSFVLSTATKPAFERAAGTDSRDLRWRPGKVREIVKGPEDLHRRLRRVNIDWRIQEQVGWPTVASWMLEHSQALCVVNLRDHAAALYDELLAKTSEPNALFHLSTLMCPAHRLEVLATIRKKLKDKRPCLVVSTQLIEAGVDLDFPFALRALGPLDSIIQVAGRADREGRLTAALGQPGGTLIVFKPIDHRMPPNEYENATFLTETLAKTKSVQPSDLEMMAKFFEDYYSSADLGSQFVAMRKKAEFKTLAEEFEMISSRMQDVYVPFGVGRKWIDDLYKIRQLTKELRTKLQRYTVGLQPWEFRIAKTSILSELTEGSNIWIAWDAAAYSPTKGLQIGINAEALIG